MLRKLVSNDVYRSSDLTNTSYEIPKKGVICGVNIKPFKTKESKAKKLINYDSDKHAMNVTKHWGVFIHIRMEDGSQYDAVFKLDKSFHISMDEDDSNIYLNNKRRKKKKVGAVSIPNLLRCCGVNEWVELIGTEMMMLPLDKENPDKNGYMIKGIAANNYILPNYFEILK